ncbi:MAG: photosynthetic reaction center cytochrome c subunit [Acetobacteraceae bacterium]|nr:photosynthetic reaction center cytochrome c subunit [Acetobacteraceae bacterium]
MKYRFPAAVGLAFLSFLGLIFVMQTFERPPVSSVQQGFRGTGMVQVANPRLAAMLRDVNQAPPALEAASADGDRASTIYENVPLLGHLSIEQFGRLMQAMTEWVSPEAGCNGCHVEGNFAAENVYQKQVSRRMIQMVQRINTQWTNHVEAVGVTCYTCHRGQPVPAAHWAAMPEHGARGMAASADRQNLGLPSVGLASLPHDPYSVYLAGGADIRVATRTPLPSGNRQTIQGTEATYGLMMHLSQALGVNCTFCHNSRSFASWEESNPHRQTAWYGIRMLRDINADYIAPLRDILPPERRGPMGDALQANCATCHRGLSEPLYGAPMLRDYPELAPAAAAPR